MGEEDGKKKKRVVMESLGWLTESSIMPRKHRAIAGVGASSIMDLKAQLYQSQEEAKKSKELAAPDVEFHRAKKKLVSYDPLSAKNSGVEARAHKDKLELRAVKDGSVSYAALERKAEIYEKIVRGELSDEEEKEKYCVDFFGKRIEQDESRDTQRRDSSDAAPLENEDGNDDDPVVFNMKPFGLGRAAATMDNNEHKRFVSGVKVGRAFRPGPEVPLSARTGARPGTSNAGPCLARPGRQCRAGPGVAARRPGTARPG